ncbi:unnamed protein product, partial [Symbiodinium sp. CCMP2456]
MADRAAWRAAGCGWPYGCRQFFRLSAPPPGAALCKRCFPGEGVAKPGSQFTALRLAKAPTRGGERMPLPRRVGIDLRLLTWGLGPWTPRGASGKAQISHALRGAEADCHAFCRPPPSPTWPSHAGYFTVPLVGVGDFEDFNVRASLAGVAANYLRVIRLDTLPEFAAVARDEDEFLAVCVRPYVEGCRSPGTGSLLRCPAETARHERGSQARAKAWDRTWGLGRMPRRAWHPAWERPNFDTGDEDEDPAVADAILPEQLARILGPRPVTREPTEMVPYAEHAPGIHRRDPYYLARLGPWSRVIHRPAHPDLDDGIADCGRRVELRRTAPRRPSRAGCPGDGAWSAGAAATSAGPTTRRSASWSDAGPRRRAAGKDPWPTGPIFREARASLKGVPPPPPLPRLFLGLVMAWAGDVVVSYLAARGLARTATLALVEPSQARFEATVVDPLLAGFRDTASFVVHEGERPAVRAVLLHMYLEART